MEDPASTDPAARDASLFGPGPLGELGELQARFPDWLITREPGRWGIEWRFVARAANVMVSPYCVITSDAAELAAALSGGDLEPYCVTCGEWTGMFMNLDGWHHYRGDPAPGGQRVLFDAGHDVVIGWKVPPADGAR